MRYIDKHSIMKTNRNIFSSIILVCIALISCSAVKKSHIMPTERLITALQNGDNFKSVGETFDGDLFSEWLNQAQRDNHSVYIDSELIFKECIFTGVFGLKPMEGRKIYFNKELIFEQCEFQKEVYINDAFFKARVQFGNNLFRESLDLQRSSFVSICRIDDNEIAQDLILQYNKFHENLSVFGNTLGRHILMQAASVLGSTQMGNTSLYGSIDISNAHFHEIFSLDYAKKGKKLLAGNSKFYSRCYIKEMSDFTFVDLSASEIYGKYLFSHKDGLIPHLDDTIFYREN